MLGAQFKLYGLICIFVLVQYVTTYLFLYNLLENYPLYRCCCITPSGLRRVEEIWTIGLRLDGLDYDM